MKPFKSCALTIALIFYATIVSSASLKVITLKDGTTIKGELFSVENGIYTVRTEHLGDVMLSDSSILNIGTADAQAQTSSSLKGQVQDIQGEILSDEKIMEGIQRLSQDQEIMKIISDPALMQDILSYDEEKIKNNPSVQKLLQNDEIHRIMKDVEQKLDQED